MLLFSILKNPLVFILVVVPLLYSVIAHEIAHGWVAYFFGDDTARRAGRLSLNPISHIDPVGALMLSFQLPTQSRRKCGCMSISS